MYADMKKDLPGQIALHQTLDTNIPGNKICNL